jgi:hypothetical protein
MRSGHFIYEERAPGTHFIHEERAPGTHCILDWVGPRAGLDVVAKELPLPETKLWWFSPQADTISTEMTRFTLYMLHTRLRSNMNYDQHIFAFATRLLIFTPDSKFKTAGSQPYMAYDRHHEGICK